MIDYAKITVKAGDGGSGSGSFEHIKGKRRGKADGGNGGLGGSVYLEATNDLNTLEPFRFVKEYTAENGGNGLSKKRKGADGRDLTVRVPVGTVVKILDARSKIIDNNNTTEIQNLESKVYDLVYDGDKILVARGGQGGRGNCHMKDEYGRRPFKGELGEKGEFCELVLELKLIAQVGLIGLPNAGKSTLLAKLTSAKPKIADYPFTTLEPNLGVMGVGFVARGHSFSRDQRSVVSLHDAPVSQNSESAPSRAASRNSIVVADIPGLIEGASQGKGLGDLFLRHIERTRVLVHLVDATASDPHGNYQTVRQELNAYSKELTKKREIIAVNKIDLVSVQVIDKIKSAFSAGRKKVYLISAETSEGIGELVKAISKKL
ncbi:TPA: GTPase ObgE [Patescibacteria group bacterium]|uniref:GTPase Obg n=1 Tax=Candidatus Curtissbacteria bacterium GW2011_GWA1_40_16 TaxID=1618405 RepID=A0A0G0UKD0_9BACT|nr:MAG: GTPase obg [Candidatus Curtissbacteria bacterium GW2011_GWA1_40_16]HCS79259.1 GTPase ObgE [Patescibacteria group bacterium]